ncbi:hypothetical protein DVH24_001342 [Malus domestica]|uniref:Protein DETOXIFICATION n=1 Tax=Malus domestica TaxID=3750 RepID=A0A498K1C3_MALDO|nr:hypothetical protein DVH24_001342 [Malus domestica]
MARQLLQILNGLCAAMEPICGQAFGAKNIKLLHKTLLMVTFLLLLATLPISFLWHNVDKILIHFGQQEDISLVAKTYLFYLLPDLVVTSLLWPIKAYLNSQGIIVPSMFCLGLALAFHIPVKILLAKAKGLEGVAMSVWITDLMVMILLALQRKGGGTKGDGLINVSVIGKGCSSFVDLAASLPALNDDSDVANRPAFECQAVGRSLSHCIKLRLSTRLSDAFSGNMCINTSLQRAWSNNRAGPAYQSAFVSVVVSVVSGFMGGLVMLAARGRWGPLFTHDTRILGGVKKMMPLMALVEVANFLLAICGGIVQGTARPWLAMYANLGGFELLALPLGTVWYVNRMRQNATEPYAWYVQDGSVFGTIANSPERGSVLEGALRLRKMQLGWWWRRRLHERGKDNTFHCFLRTKREMEHLVLLYSVPSHIPNGTLGVVLAFKVSLGLSGLLGGFLIGTVACLILLLIFVLRINWEEACKAQTPASVGCQSPELNRDGNHKTVERVDDAEV